MPSDSDTYVQTTDTLESAAAKLTKGQISSFAAHPSSGIIRYVMINAPGFGGQPRSAFLGTVEFVSDDYRPLWELALASPGIWAACVGFEEGVELDDSKLTASSFPWSQWPLVIGGVRSDASDGPWIVHNGPEMRWFRGKA
jgi:hypothetical protein